MRTRKLTVLGMGIALYVVLSYTVKIPLINQIRTDFGYLVFGVFLCIYGWQASVVGVFGCIISNLLYSGTFPLGWALGQLFIGLFCGWLLPKQKSRVLRCLTAAIAVLIGIAGIKTIVESVLFNLPLGLKVVRGLVAAVADLIPFLAGILISDHGIRSEQKTMLLFQRDLPDPERLRQRESGERLHRLLRREARTSVEAG